MESYLRKNLGGGVQMLANRSSEEAARTWRRLRELPQQGLGGRGLGGRRADAGQPLVGMWRKFVGVVKNPTRRFSEVTASARKRKTNHEKLRVAVLVVMAARRFIRAIRPRSEYKHSEKALGRWRKDIAVHFTPADQIEEQQKRCADYSLKALGFAITTFIAYRVAAPSASSTSATFKIAMAAFFLAVATDLVSVARPPKWGSLLTYLSWFLLVLLSYLLLISFNKVYGYAIFPVFIPIVIVLRQLKLGHGAWQRFNMGDQQAVGAPDTDLEAGQDVNTDDGALNTSDKTDKDLDGIFNLSAGIVNFGGFINMILGYYMSGPNKPRAAGFFFFFTIVLGLYLMMATSVRTVELARHARLLSYLLIFLLLSTLFATMIHKVPGRDSSHV